MPLNLSCPHCGVTNRVPAEKLADAPKCGRCAKKIFVGEPQDLTAANVNAVLTRNDVPVLVDCWASWCGPCQQFAPTFEQAAKKFEPQVRFAKLNTETEQGVAGRWNIRSIPTLILFKQGKEVARMSGVLALPQLQQWLGQQGVVF